MYSHLDGVVFLLQQPSLLEKVCLLPMYVVDLLTKLWVCCSCSWGGRGDKCCAERDRRVLGPVRIPRQCITERVPRGWSRDSKKCKPMAVGAWSGCSAVFRRHVRLRKSLLTSTEVGCPWFWLLLGPEDTNKYTVGSATIP